MVAIEILKLCLNAFHRSKKLQEESPLEGRITLSGGENTQKNHIKIKSACLRIFINLSRWIWSINCPDRVGISQVGDGSCSDMIDRRWVITDIAIGISQWRTYQRGFIIVRWAIVGITSAYRYRHFQRSMAFCIYERSPMGRTPRRY